MTEELSEDAANVALLLDKEIDKRVALALTRLLSGASGEWLHTLEQRFESNKFWDADAQHELGTHIMSALVYSNALHEAIRADVNIRGAITEMIRMVIHEHLSMLQNTLATNGGTYSTSGGAYYAIRK